MRAVRRQRPALPILVRAPDDTHLEDLLEAGATEVVPETLEAALTLVSNTLHMLQVPASRVIRTVGEIRRQRYKALRSVIGRDPAGPADESGTFREELHTVVLPPGAWSIGRSISEIRGRGAEVSFTAVRRDGIVGRDPDPGDDAARRRRRRAVRHAGGPGARRGRAPRRLKGDAPLGIDAGKGVRPLTYWKRR